MTHEISADQRVIQPAEAVAALEVPSQPESASELLAALLRACCEQQASDIHLSSGLPPYMRVHGIVAPQPGFGVVTASMLERLVDVFALGSAREQLQLSGSCDGAISAADGTRFRLNVFRRSQTLSIALRRLDDHFRPLKELGLPESLYELCDLANGLVVVGGPTGSGKSTTLATLIDRINETHPAHIITIEDPIEYIHVPKRSLVNQRQVGSDARSFDDALVASLRQDPDVILVGEIRDLPTIRTAITAAETGHLVFTTVHAGDCVGVIERLVSVFPADEQVGVRRQLSLVLQAVVVQQLLVADGAKAKFNEHRPAARRRVIASEILRNTPAVANLIATGKSAQIYSSMESGSSLGMQTLDHDLARLWVAGLISEQTARAFARSFATLDDRASRFRQGKARA